MAKRKRVQKRNIGTDSTPIRVSKEFMRIIREEKARALLNGKTPPTSAMISKIIAKKIRKVGLE
jgi:hypothetical protein